MQEATCEEGAEAEVIVIFDVGDWVGFEMADGFGCRNTNGGRGEGAGGWGCGVGDGFGAEALSFVRRRRIVPISLCTGVRAHRQGRQGPGLCARSRALTSS